MRHIAQESLAEFVRHALAPTEAEQVEQHVAECRECADLAALFREVVRVGANETSYEPPQGTLRSAKAYFEAQQKLAAQPRGLFELLFDSLAQPAVAGARASVASARQ